MEHLRLVFVNQVHPETPHVSGMRAYHFAREMSKRGHKVVLLCQWREGTVAAPSPNRVSDLLGKHDWAQPLVLAVKPRACGVLDRVRSPGTYTLLRKGLVLWNYLRYSGVFTDFSAAAKPYEVMLAKEFAPGLSWGIFGNTDSWLVAQGIARLANVPWVADVKDGWDPFIPAPLRKLIARRFHDAAAMTANSRYQAELTKRWFPHDPVVVYSGVPSYFLDGRPVARERNSPRVTLVGSVYRQKNLGLFLEGVRLWAQNRSWREPRPTFVYAGGETEKVRRAAQRIEGFCDLEMHGHLELERLFDLCSSSFVNAYLWSPLGFHHKLIELLCCRRPIIAFPGEREEAFHLARKARGHLLACKTPNELRATLSTICEKGGLCEPVCDRFDLRQFTWEAQAERLFDVFKRVTKSNTHDKDKG